MTRRLLPLLAWMVLLVPDVARGEGLNLAWNNCANSPSASDNFSFSCDDEGQVATLVGSFVAPAGVDSFIAMEAALTVVTDGRTTPDFWQMGDDGCRSTAASPVFSASGLSGCANPWGSQVLGFWNMTSQGQPPGKPLIRVDAVRPLDHPQPLSSGREYFAFQLKISTEGVTTCQGCKDGACFVMNSISLFEPATAYHDVVITTTALRNYVTWQGGGAACPGARANRRVSLSQIKAIYR